jgi:hypothetical protein
VREKKTIIIAPINSAQTLSDEAKIRQPKKVSGVRVVSIAAALTTRFSVDRCNSQCVPIENRFRSLSVGGSPTP